MRYYIVSLDQREVHVPVIANLYQTIPVMEFFKGETWKIPFRSLLQVKNCGWEPRYLKLLFSPFPLIHESLLSVFEAYGCNYIQKQMIFLDTAFRKSELYYLIMFRQVKGKIIEGDLVICNRREVADLDVFYLMDRQKCLLICSLAIIESLLWEGVTGIQLKPVEIREEVS
ncbi:MAG: hypothetical protein LIP16_05105 [Clostridium sp.]|nr:hypothetical protein [Clostridium sp.]